MNYQQHPDEDVRHAIIRLSDALCSWERNTGIESILIIRDDRGFCYRAQSGKPVDSSNDDIPDAQLIGMINGN